MLVCQYCLKTIHSKWFDMLLACTDLSITSILSRTAVWYTTISQSCSCLLVKAASPLCTYQVIATALISCIGLWVISCLFESCQHRAQNCQLPTCQKHQLACQSPPCPHLQLICLMPPHHHQVTDCPSKSVKAVSTYHNRLQVSAVTLLKISLCVVAA